MLFCFPEFFSLSSEDCGCPGSNATVVSKLPEFSDSAGDARRKSTDIITSLSNSIDSRQSGVPTDS